MPKIVTTHSPEETEKVAQTLASQLKGTETLLLHGNLGAGKSVFARALIREITENPELEVPSPTFTLVQTYDAPASVIYHFDLYRLEDPDEIFELGWEEAQSEGLSLIEWPERLGPYKPRETLDIHIRSIDNDSQTREISITPYDE